MSPPRPVPENYLFRAGPAPPRPRHHYRVNVRVGRRFRCTMCIECGQVDPGAVIRPVIQAASGSGNAAALVFFPFDLL